VPVLAAVPEPSSLAVELAEEVGVALVGLLRGLTMTFYAHARRVRTRDRPAHETVAGPEQVGIRATTGRSRAQPKYVNRPLRPTWWLLTNPLSTHYDSTHSETDQSVATVMSGRQ
jgi:hypothetical protein